MNLHAIVSGAIGVVNPQVNGQVQVSTGYTTLKDGERVPSYADAFTVPIQCQALTAKDLAQTDSLNIQGVLQAFYLNGDIEGVDRPFGKGGDLISFGAVNVPTSLQNTTWLVQTVLETWDTGWCKVAGVLQLRPGT